MTEPRQDPATGALPVAVTRFVGRRREVAEVRELLAQSRLVTLTGVGGVGKTRLAVEVAGQVRRAFPDGVWLVDLAVLQDGSRIADAVANVLAVADRTNRPSLAKVEDHLRKRQALVLLDNCEHVAADCTRFVDRLLRHSTGLRVLATSRHTLGADGEHLFAVPPLGVPDPWAPQRATVIGQFDAVQLLVDRVSAIRPGFGVSDENAEAVARLCTQLDGLPLAIELAATRLRTLSVQQLVDRLTGRFALLTGGSTAAQPRQQTLRALVDWSHALCAPAQRLLWARLSVFNGSFDLAAAERVCSDDGPLPVADVFDLLDHLVAQSVVLTDVDQGSGAIRFRLLETIRQYGRERLVGLGEVVTLSRRHRDHYLASVERTAERWCGPQQAQDLARLHADLGNLRAALEASIAAEPPDVAAALRLVTALRNLWYAGDLLSEGRRWLDRALDLSAEPGQERPRALWVAAWVCLLQGDEAAAGRRLDECEQLGGELGDGRAVAHATSLRATAALFAGELERAAELFELAERELTRSQDVEGLLWCLFQLAITRAHQGRDGEEVAAICHRSLRISERHGERLCRSYTLWVLGFTSWLHGDGAAAERQVAEGLAIQAGFSDAVGAALIIETLAWIAASRDQLPLAASRLAAARTAWEAAGTSLAAFGPPLQVHHDACLARVERGSAQPTRSSAGPSGPTGPLDRIIVSVLADCDTGGERRPARTAASPRATGTDPLTARELAVAELVTRGMSNRAIAAALVISPRTVDGHLERILAKLGFHSRTQVAGWLAARQSVTEGDIKSTQG